MTIDYVKNNLKKIRENRGMTCTEFANVLGVNKLNVSNWERGKTEMNDVTAYGIIYVVKNILPEIKES